MAAWGDNDSGQLGDNGVSGFQSLMPVAVNTTTLADGERFARAFNGSYANHALALVAAPPNPKLKLTDARILANGTFQFAFTDIPGTIFSVLATTNPALPVSTWTPLSGLTEVSPGQFQFNDPQATNCPQRFYRVRSP